MGCQMAEYLDFFNRYVMGVTEISVQFYFLSKILNKKVWAPFYLLFATGAVIANDFVPDGTILGFAALVFLLMAYGIFVCRAGFKASVLYAVLTAEIMLLCYEIVNSLTVFLYAWRPAVFHSTAGVAVMLFGEAASLALTGVCYFMVYRYFSCHTAAEMQQIFLVFIPILMIFIMGEYISSIAFESRQEVLADDGFTGYLFRHWYLFVIPFLGLFSLFCVLFVYQKLLRAFRLDTELSLLEQEEHFLNQYVEEAKMRYDRTKSFRHDIRNHIAVVKKLLKSGKQEEAAGYIEDMEDMAEEMSFPCGTNNPAADILVGNKLGIAKNMGIDVSCSLFLPYPCGLRDIDLCIVLSNALDNAIHACKSLGADAEKYIHVSGRIQGDFLMMEVRNSFHGKGAFKKGTGLSNVKTVAEKYGGAMSIETQGNVFVLHVLLIIPQHSKDIPRQMD